MVGQRHWPSLRAIILVTSRDAKDISSTVGMQYSVKTSEFLRHRIEDVPKHIEKYIKFNLLFFTFTDLRCSTHALPKKNYFLLI